MISARFLLVGFWTIAFKVHAAPKTEQHATACTEHKRHRQNK
jgi:hypothetical protein